LQSRSPRSTLTLTLTLTPTLTPTLTISQPKINEDPKDAMLREFQEEIARLRAKLDGKPMAGSGGGGGQGGGTHTARRLVERMVDVEVEKIIEVEREVEVEKIVEVERIVEVEKLVEVERVVERAVEVEVVREVVREVPVMVEREVERLVGMREEEVEEMQRQMQFQAETERQALLDQNQLGQEEMVQSQQEWEEMNQRVEVEAGEREKIEAELALLQGKVMHGGEHIKDRVQRQQRELEEAEREIAEQQEREVQLRQEAQRKQEARLGMEEQHTTLQEEVEVKSRKLKQLWAKFRAAQAEVQDLQLEQQQQKEDLLLTVRELTRQLQLQNLVIESFVPPEEVETLEARAVWGDDDSEEWRLLARADTRDPTANNRPVSHPRLLRPTSAFTRECAADPGNANNPRFRADNVLTFDLDMPERTTTDYETDINPGVRAALTAALHDDEQLELEAEENLPSMPGGGGWMPGQAAAPAAAAPKKKAGASSRRRRKEANDDLDGLLGMDERSQAPAESAFPQSRGLVR